MGGAQRLWFTDGVHPSPVSDGVEQVWLPLTPHYSSMETMPIHVDDAWQVVLTGGPSSRTEPIGRADERMATPQDLFRRPDPERPPDLFAIREYGAGRILMYGFRVQHRMQTHGTFKLLFNAFMEAGGPVT